MTHFVDTDSIVTLTHYEHIMETLTH